MAFPIVALAQSAYVQEPPSLRMQPLGRGAGTGPEVLESPSSARPVIGNEVAAHLDIVPLRSQIWNPNNNRFDQVELRAYQESTSRTPADRPYVAPKLVANPGDTVRVFLRNLLPPEPDCPRHTGDINTPHCFNTTNLHSHGLWVSPAGISDNVLRTLVPNPNFTYEYEYNIPAEHPAGTFWYHPHVHGSTAIQVASGLAGALIIQGSRLPEYTGSPTRLAPGDIDVILKRNGRSIPDRVFVLQQIQYICRNPESTTVPKASKLNPDNTWRCDPGDIGVLDGYDVFGGTRWDNSGRFTTVNGATAAPLEQVATAGIPERWRFIHGGVADTVKVSIRKKISTISALESAAVFSTSGVRAQQETVSRECAPEPAALAQFEIAADGLTRPAILERASTTMQPGYRSDLLVAFQEPGTYCVIDEEVNVPTQGVEGGASSRRLLFLVTVNPNPQSSPLGSPREMITNMLVSAAQALPIRDAALKNRVVTELTSGLWLSAFAPHETLVGKPIDVQQKLYFTLTQAKTRQTDGSLGAPLGLGIGHTPETLRRFDPRDLERTLVVGNTDEWELRVDPRPPAIGHPFHIHVNPFEIIAVEKDGVEQTALATSQYFGMKGVFKDTIFVEPGVTVRFRSHYRRYVGDFVLHCHILNHEDAGMMEMVRVADRDGNGKPIPFGHGLLDVTEASHQHR